MIRKAETTLTAAGAYIRMSGDRQEKSPAQQRVEITKLAKHEGFAIVEWQTDEAITGNTTTEDRPGLAALLAAAKAGKFKTVLALHTNRISREDPMDAVVFYNQLRKAGVGLHTCAEGAIDLDSFTAQLLLFVNQKASNDFLTNLAQRTLIGKIANAKAGGRNGGPTIYAMDRAVFTDDGRLIRRLQPGECVKMPGHHVRLVPSTDAAKIEAIRYAYNRLDAADLSFRELARELAARGYPSPRGTGWTHNNVIRLLSTKAYIGVAQWGREAWGEYYTAVGEEIIPAAGKSTRRGHRKQQEDAIAIAGAYEGIISPDLFNRIQSKLSRQASPRATGNREDYPLAGLLFCEHCGAKMIGEKWTRRDRRGNVVYQYVNYVCGTYAKFGIDEAHTCGHHAVDARRVLGWLVYKLQEELLGPGRDALVKEITKQLTGQAKANGGDVERLQKRAADLDREVGRLVKAIRSIDAAELVEELAIVRTERDRVKAELTQAGRFTHAADIDAEAQKIADQLWATGQQLQTKDPATLRGLLHKMVDKIKCRWNRNPGRQRSRYELAEGNVELHPQTPFDVCRVVEHTSPRTCPGRTAS